MGKTPAQLALLDLLVNLVRTEKLALMEKKANPASLVTPLPLQQVLMVDAVSAPTDPKAQLDPLDLLAHPAHLEDLDLLENPVLLANLAQLAQPDHQDLPDPMANQDPRELQVPPALVAAKDSPDPKVPPAKMAHPAPLAVQARKEPMANLALKDPQDLPDHLAQPVLLEKMAPLDHRDPQGPMPNTAPAPNELEALLLPNSKQIEPTTTSLKNQIEINTEQLAIISFLHYLAYFCLSLTRT